ncbi:MAG TPA: murein biosynthesis integral membrane protein MurJ, partial [Thermoanaerobaculia bacterium]|nr:murein biosynthesis integral membrane protein MurJ [Thermoanaerobaculia bacterium]
MLAPVSRNDTPTNPGDLPAFAPLQVPAHHHSALSAAVRAVFSVTLLSRLGGLARDVILARVFGDTWVNSAFQSAFAIPNMFRRLFGEGALSAAFIPEYTDAHLKDQHEADQLASLTVWWLGLITSAITVVLELILLLLLLILPQDPERALSLRLIMVMLPFMPLICIVAILGGILQVHGRFAASSTGPLVLNTFIIVTGLYAVITGHVQTQATAYLFGIATTLSGLTQAIWFARLLRPHVKWTRAFAQARPRARVMLKRFVPVMLGLGTLQLNAFLDMLIAMWPIWVGPTILGVPYPLDASSNGILASAQRLYQFPLGVFGIAVATAVFPLLARHALDPQRFADTLRRGIRLSLLLGVPASIGLMLVRDDLTAVLFGARITSAGVPSETGFSPTGLARSAAVLLGYAPAVWVFSLNHVLIRAFYARGDTVTPMRVSMGLVVINFVCNVALIWPLHEAGLAWSSSFTAAVQLAVLATLLSRSGVDIVSRESIMALARILAASLLMGALCWGVLAAWPQAPTRLA